MRIKDNILTLTKEREMYTIYLKIRDSLADYKGSALLI